MTGGPADESQNPWARSSRAYKARRAREADLEQPWPGATSYSVEIMSLATEWLDPPRGGYARVAKAVFLFQGNRPEDPTFHATLTITADVEADRSLVTRSYHRLLWLLERPDVFTHGLLSVSFPELTEAEGAEAFAALPAKQRFLAYMAEHGANRARRHSPFGRVTRRPLRPVA